VFIVDDDDEGNLRKTRKGRCEEDDDGWELERLELFSVWSLMSANTHNHHRWHSGFVFPLDRWHRLQPQLSSQIQCRGEISVRSPSNTLSLKYSPRTFLDRATWSLAIDLKPSDDFFMTSRKIHGLDADAKRFLIRAFPFKRSPFCNDGLLVSSTLSSPPILGSSFSGYT
jgi:hypothetical protein